MPGDEDYGDSVVDRLTNEDRLYPEAVYAASFETPDARVYQADDRSRVQALLDAATPPLGDDERLVFTTMRGLVDGMERTAPETAHVLNLTAVRTQQLADQALKKVKRGASGITEFSVPEVSNEHLSAQVRMESVARSLRSHQMGLPNQQ